ncbi:MAG: copper-binding protein [Magnetococcales bacterium]|nr:copper-binding protein [Magnetococcales bacterium]
MKRWRSRLLAGVFGVCVAGAGMAWAGQSEPDITGEGKLNSIDPGKRSVNIHHGPIPVLQWPAMTMDFAVAPGVDLKPLQPGKNVRFILKKEAQTGYRITGITPTP